MYTQCSNCETVFKLSAEVLRAAGGQVRCGRCGEVFSALARLAENASAFESRETPQDLEERADSILEAIGETPSVARPEPAEEPDSDGVEIAHLQVLDFSAEDLEIATKPDAPARPAAPAAAAAPRAPGGDISMEFTLPPGELDRIFVEAKTGVPPPFPLHPESPKMPVAPPKAAPTARPPEPVAANSFVPPKPLAAPPVELSDGGPLPDLEVVRDNRGSNGGGLISDFTRRQLQANLDPAEFDLGKRPSALATSFSLWLGAAIVAALLLVVQIVHHNREWLAQHGPFGPLLRAVYSTLGAPVSVPANLAAYQLRQWGVTGDPSADGTLKVRASIMNTTAQLVPYPLLRVTLANRYGNHLGARDFEPSEYLGKPTARLLAPGERVDATLKILDPGKDAEGFEIDVCLRGSTRKIICANDVAAPQAKP